MNVFSVIPDIYFVECNGDIGFVSAQLGYTALVGNNYKLTKCQNTYVVKPLDTFSKVAFSLGITEDELLKITKTKQLFIGQKIDLPKI